MQFRSRSLIVAAVLLCLVIGFAEAAQAVERVLLWPGGAPMAADKSDTPDTPDTPDTETHPDKPTLDLYILPAEQSNGTAVLVCPGGGYGNLAMGHEGQQIGEFFNALGVNAFVLRYRHAPAYRHPVPMLDVQRAMRWVRAHAEKYHVKPDRIGVMGFSAGGHLAATLTTHFDAGQADAADPIDRASCRPDFSILCYGVLSMDPKITHGGSRANLIGADAAQELTDLMSNEKQVTGKTPPVFLFHTADDGAVPVANSVRFFSACHAAGVAAELHIFRTGPHGVGLAQNRPLLAAWPDLLSSWMRGLKLIPSGK
jgi:acetyl esterase/lipase